MKKISLFIFTLCISTIGFSQLMYPGDVSLGTPEMIFDYSADACNAENSVDAYARVFRDVNNDIQLLLSHTSAFRMVGSNFDNLSVDCANGAIFESDNDSTQGNYNYAEWLYSPYTEDGKTIHALVHQEYHGYDFSGMCNSSDPLDCWYNAISYATSSDTGKTYTQPNAPNHLVASTPYTYDPNFANRQGAFGPSNIIKHPTDGYYYAMFYTEEYQDQQGGTCLMRTNNLSDPTSWRFWNGTDFSLTNSDPYNAPAPIPGLNTFTTVSGGKQLAGLSYSTYFDMFILVGPSKKWVASLGGYVEGFYYMLSDDLLEWSAPKLMYPINLINTGVTPNLSLEYGMYPSLIDHADTSRNFEYVGQTAYLYYTKWNNSVNTGDPNRDLMRVEVTFSKNMVDGFVVTGTGNKVDGNPGDGVCETETVSGLCSFYAAIEESNNRLPRYRDSVIDITFATVNKNINLNTNGITISAINYPVNINGNTHSSGVVNTNDISNGTNAVPGISFDFNTNVGITVNGNNSNITGLNLHNYNGPGLTILGENNTVSGNFIGTDVTGATNQSAATGGTGISIRGSHNTVGGVNNADINLVAGGVRIEDSTITNTTVTNNLLGTNAAGTAKLDEIAAGIESYGSDGNFTNNIVSGNQTGGVKLYTGSGNTVSGNTIGLSADLTTIIGNGGAGITLSNSTNNSISNNYINGNSSEEAGIWIDNAHNNTIVANTIGTGATGNENLGNLGSGIILFGNAQNNNIGGTTENEQNIIAFNDKYGLEIWSAENTQYGNNRYYANIKKAVEIGGDNFVNEEYLPSITSALFNTLDSTLTISVNAIGTGNNAYLFFYINDSCDISGYGEGSRVLGKQLFNYQNSSATIVTATFNILPTDVGKPVTVLMTDVQNPTEFSTCQTIEIPNASFTSSINNINSSMPVNSGEQTNVYLINTGSSEVNNLTYATSQNWNEITLNNTNIPVGDSVLIEVALASTGLASGTYYDTLTIIASNAINHVEIPIELHVQGGPTIFVDAPDTMYYDIALNNAFNDFVWVKNTGDATLNYNSGNALNSTWINITGNKTGSISAGDSVKIDFQINTPQLNLGENIGMFWISSNDPNNQVQEIFVNVNVFDPTSINEVLQETIKVYPNPFNDLINISASNGHWEVYAIDGKLVDTGVLTKAKPIDTQQWPTGNYVLKINTEHSSRHIKLVKY